MIKKKKLILLSTIITVVLILLLGFIIINKKNNYKKLKLSDINEKYYDISIDTNNLIATIDGKKYKISDLDNVSKKKLYKYLKDNAYGTLKKKKNTINIVNAYSMKSLIVKTNDVSALNKYKDIISINEISDDLYKVVYKDAKDTKDGYNDLKLDKNITSVSTDVKVKAFDVKSSAVNSSLYAWGVTSMGLDVYTKKLEKENNNNTIKVAVLDTGIRYTHQAFYTTSNGNIDRISSDGAYDYVNEDSDPTDDNDHGYIEYNNEEIRVPEYGHGTMVSGLIAESTPKNVKIVPVKVLDAAGSGSLSNVMRGINGVKDKVDIINMSLGADSSDTNIEAAIKSIYKNSEVIMVAAAGNEAGPVSYPASSSYTLAISSVDNNDNFSSWFSNYGSKIDFAAPGEGLTLPCLNSDTCYVTNMAGTSFSSPLAAAALALIKAENPSFTRNEIIEELKQNVKDLGATGKDIYYGWGSIGFAAFINNLSVSDTWDKTNRLNVLASSISTTNYYAITTSEIEPTSWTKLGNSNEINISKDINTNGTYYLWIKNRAVTHKKFIVNHVDDIKPKIVNNLSNSTLTPSKIKVKLTAKDQESGIASIKWYYRRSDDTNYNELTDSIDNITNELTKEKTITGLASNTKYLVYAKIYDAAGNYIKTNEIEVKTQINDGRPYVSYKTHVQNVGWQEEKVDGQISGTSGKSLRLEGIKIYLNNKGTYTGKIEYQTHIQNIGWQGYTTEGKLSGTTGKSLRLEAIRIKLTGDISNYYDIYYRVHVQNIGWLDWAKNGESAGSAGYSYRLEAIQIQLVEKGDDAPGKTTTPYKAKMLKYSTHVQNVGWQNYVADGATSGTTGRSLRLEGIKIKLENTDYSGSVEYKTHVQNVGWQDYVKDDIVSGTTGRSLRLEAIQIRLTGDIANYYDIYYRTHVQSIGWLGWAKNNQISGTTGYAYRLEGIEAKLVKKSETFTGNTNNTYMVK